MTTSSIYSKIKDSTMVPESGVQFTAEKIIEVIKSDIPGVLVECGVWKGGCSLAMLLAQREAFGEVRRPVFLMDSFSGLPPVEGRDGPAAAAWQANNTLNNCATPETGVRDRIRRHGFVENKDFHIIPGWFKDTVSRLNDMTISVLRLDCDWYSSVKTCLDGLASNVSIGGTIIIDDYYAWDGCARAVHDYFSENDLSYRIRSLQDFSSAYFERTVKNISTDYNQGFFNMHKPWKGEYELIADSLVRHLNFYTVVDLGCGNGYVLSRLAQAGKTVMGVDGSKFSPFSGVIVSDLSQPIDVGMHDLVICTEVAEHIEEKYADVLMDNICKSSRSTVFFSAAIPGRGGHLHLNEQPHSYWIDKFHKRGFNYNLELTMAILEDLRTEIREIWWFPMNIMVFRK